MNPEDLCKKMQEVKKTDSKNYHEEERCSQEYAHKYVGRPGYSVRKHLQIIRAEQQKYRRNY